MTAAYAPAARAEPITFAFRGTVTDVQTQQGAYNTPVVNWPGVGNTFAGTYTFESTAPDSAPAGGQGLYYNPDPTGPIGASIGDFRWFAPASAIGVFDNPSVGAAEDIYEVTDWIPSMQVTTPPELAGPFNRWNFSLRLEGNGTFLDTAALALTPPDLSRATVRRLTLSGDNGLNTTPVPIVMFTASLDSLTFVPDPTGLGVVFAALPLLRPRRRGTRVRTD